jgi:hypothetical protein
MEALLFFGFVFLSGFFVGAFLMFRHMRNETPEERIKRKREHEDRMYYMYHP